MVFKALVILSSRLRQLCFDFKPATKIVINTDGSSSWGYFNNLPATMTHLLKQTSRFDFWPLAD